MKAEIIYYPNGLGQDNHTFYRLELCAETDEDKEMLELLNKQLVCWVSPHLTRGKMVSWWGKK